MKINFGDWIELNISDRELICLFKFNCATEIERKKSTSTDYTYPFSSPYRPFQNFLCIEVFSEIFCIFFASDSLLLFLVLSLVFENENNSTIEQLENKDIRLYKAVCFFSFYYIKNGIHNDRVQATLQDTPWYFHSL